jgi:alpha-glucosidase
LEAHERATRRPQWWPGATLYQIYVRSWRDSDGDGYGDLPGVIAGARLSGVAGGGRHLAVADDAFPRSRLGYDVSDYLAVHPRLGTLDDLDRAGGGGRAGGDIAVLLDLVPNHTSSAHPWFVDARSGRGSAHRGYYIWADPAADGGPPNNWLSATGAHAWTLDDDQRPVLPAQLPAQPSRT